MYFIFIYKMRNIFDRSLKLLAEVRLLAAAVTFSSLMATLLSGLVSVDQSRHVPRTHISSGS